MVRGRPRGSRNKRPSLARTSVLREHYRGLTPAEIARELDKKLNTVCMMLSRLGIRPNRRPILRRPKAQVMMRKAREKKRVVPPGKRQRFESLLRRHWHAGLGPTECSRLLHSKVQVYVKPKTISTMAHRKKMTRGVSVAPSRYYWEPEI